MKTFYDSIQNFNSEKFNQTLKAQIKALAPGSLPLEKGLTQGGYVDDSDIDITILHNNETDTEFSIKLGVFFTEIVINCGCGDDPMPINAYCEMRMLINKQTANAIFEVI